MEYRISDAGDDTDEIIGSEEGVGSNANDANSTET